MQIYGEDTIQLTGYGKQDCSDMHSWGPGMRLCYIIHYIIKGAGYFLCGNKKYRIEAGESFFICPYEKVHYWPDINDPWVYVWVNFTGRQVPCYMEGTGLTRNHPVCGKIEKESVTLLFDRFCGLDFFDKNRQEANGILLTILGLYADKWQTSRHREAGKEEDIRLKNALFLIHANYHKSSFHIESLCQMMYINRVTLYRLFQKYFEVSPNAYLIGYRISQAKKMLLLGESVNCVAVSCGFRDPFYFSKVFKKVCGVVPSQYSKKGMKKEETLPADRFQDSPDTADIPESVE